MNNNFLKSELGRGAFILFITMNIFNFLNFLFHFSMARLLGPSGYGTLAVLMSLIYIYSVPTEALQNIASRYTSKFNIQKEDGKIKFFMLKFLKKGSLIASIFFILVSVGSILLASFLEINYWLIFLTNLILFASFSAPIARGILQGKKKFKKLGISLIFEAGVKLICSILLVYFGFSVFGAIGGFLAGVFFGVIISIYFNKDLLEEKEEGIRLGEVYSASIPYFLAMFAILLVASLDILLAKRFFSPELAGKYAVLSMLGKMIFLGTMAIGKAMFPLTSEKKDSNEDSSELFKKSLFIVGLICLIIIGIFAIFPELLISVLYGSQYVEMSPYLLYSTISFSFLSLSNLILTYGLSTHKLKKSYLLLSFIFVEIFLLSSFNSSILEYIKAFMASNIVMFIGSLFLIKK